MDSWKRILERGQNARDWDAPRPGNETISALRALFEAARDDAPTPDEKLWERLHPQLAAHEPEDHYPLSFVSTLASTGPRLAMATLGVFLLTASLLWGLGTERRMNLMPPQTNLMVSFENPMNPIHAIGNGLETQTGQELLQYIAYDSPDRPPSR